MDSNSSESDKIFYDSDEEVEDKIVKQQTFIQKSPITSPTKYSSNVFFQNPIKKRSTHINTGGSEPQPRVSNNLRHSKSSHNLDKKPKMRLNIVERRTANMKDTQMPFDRPRTGQLQWERKSNIQKAQKTRKSNNLNNKTSSYTSLKPNHIYDKLIDRTMFLELASDFLENKSCEPIVFINCVIDFDVGRLMREIFF